MKTIPLSRLPLLPVLSTATVLSRLRQALLGSVLGLPLLAAAANGALVPPMSGGTGALPLAGAMGTLTCVFSPSSPACRPVASNLTLVADFGSNPGNLEMLTYVPADLGTAPRPVVVALHGCTQAATSYDDETGWIRLADRLHFSLVFPQQKAANHFNQCFRWFDRDDTARNQGEALSIKQMVDRIKTGPGTDPARIYVTGLSAGGAMTAVMLATYPELFAGGAIIAGIPYQCADSETAALNQCGVLSGNKMTPEKKNMTPAQWGELVRRASPSGNAFPALRMSIWHGDADRTVDPQNATEMMKQWTDALGIDTVPEVDEILFKDTAHPAAHRVYANGANVKLLETFLIKGMNHGTPVDPRNAADPCGSAQPFILDVGICSSARIAAFWGLAP